MHKIISFQTIDSTSSYLKRNFGTLGEGDVCFSIHQTNGRGRLGRKWEDKGEDLLFSILFLNDLNEDFLHSLPLIAGAAMQRMLLNIGITSSIKWPNDILINGQKVCGILAEGVTSDKVDALILGIGLNLNELSFDGELTNKATSLFLCSGKTYDQKRILDLFLAEFDYLLNDFRSGGDVYLKTVQDYFYLLNKEVSLNYHNEGLFGVVKGMDDKGNLLLESQGNLLHIGSGEVSLESQYRK